MALTNPWGKLAISVDFVLTERDNNLAKLAAAYYKVTGLSPEECALYMQYEEMGAKFWFGKRYELEQKN